VGITFRFIKYASAETRPGNLWRWLPLWSNGQSSRLLNGDVLCFLWGMNWIYVCYVEESRPPLWSSGQSSWLQNGENCASCEVRTEFIYVMQKKVDRLCGLVVRVPGYRFPALLDFLGSSGSGTGPTQPRVYNWGATWKKK
jgi:hypothetical protein